MYIILKRHQHLNHTLSNSAQRAFFNEHFAGFVEKCLNAMCFSRDLRYFRCRANSRLCREQNFYATFWMNRFTKRRIEIVAIVYVLCLRIEIKFCYFLRYFFINTVRPVI